MVSRFLNRDIPLLVALALFVVVAITTGMATSEKMKSTLLRFDATDSAARWQPFLEQKLGLLRTDPTLVSRLAEGQSEDIGYRLYDWNGALLLGRDGQSGPSAKSSSLEPALLREIHQRRSSVRLFKGPVNANGDQRVVARVYTPVTRESRPHVLEISFDQTRRAGRYDHIFRIGAFVTIALVLLGVGLPGGLLWHHTNARRKVERRAEYLARHDSLTGLENRASFLATLEHSLESARDWNHITGVLSIGVDRFRHINDSLGHAVGDALLKELSARCRVFTRGSDIVGRMGSDEFAVVATGFRKVEEIAAFAEDLRMSLMEPLEIQGHYLCPNVSIGVSVAPADGELPSLLYKNAALSMNLAKADERQRVRFFLEGMDNSAKDRLRLEMDIRRAIDDHQFVLLYQPQFNLTTGDLVGCEALLRWNHPEMGIIQPDRFIPIAEELGAIDDLGAWILHQACADAMTWPQPVPVAVNLSPAQFTGDTLAHLVINVLEDSGLPPERLELEITEGLILSDTDEALKLLHRFREIGVSIAMDDFGTGYSSLSYLTRFPYTKLKIDKSLLWRIEADCNVEAVIRSIVALGRSLKMKVLVEGVETEKQSSILRSAGCHLVQGYLYSRPVSNDDILDYMTSPQPRRASEPVAAASSAA